MSQKIANLKDEVVILDPQDKVVIRDPQDNIVIHKPLIPTLNNVAPLVYKCSAHWVV